MNYKLLILLAFSSILFSCATKTKKEFCLDKEIISQNSCDKEWSTYQEARAERLERQREMMDEVGGSRR